MQIEAFHDWGEKTAYTYAKLRVSLCLGEVGRQESIGKSHKADLISASYLSSPSVDNPLATDLSVKCL